MIITTSTKFLEVLPHCALFFRNMYKVRKTAY